MIAIQRRAVVDEYRQFSFNRNSVAFGSNGRLYYPHQARFESVNGRTGVLVEESTTNLRVRSDLMDGVASTGPAGEITVSTVSVPLLGYQTQTRRVSRTGSTTWAFAEWSANITSSAAHAVSVYIRPDTVVANEISRVVLIEVDSNPQRHSYVEIHWGSNGTIANLKPNHGSWTAPLSYGYEPAGDGWYRVWFVCPADVNPSVTPRVRINPCMSSGSVTDKAVLVGGVQVEQKNYPTSLMPTSGSATTRAAETLTVPTAGVPPKEWTIEFLVYLQGDLLASVPTRYITLFATATQSYTHNVIEFSRQVGVTNRWFLRTTNGLATSSNASGSWSPTQGWHYFALRANTAASGFFIDGQKIAETNNPNLPDVLNATASLGYAPWTVTQYSNTLIGPVRISRRARTDQEIADAYAAGTLTADADTTLLLPFTGPDAQRGARVLYVPAVGF